MDDREAANNSKLDKLEELSKFFKNHRITTTHSVI
jgi:hypothetical protein